MASVKEALAKKGGLTLASLKTYDDLATDVLVDQVSARDPCRAGGDPLLSLQRRC